MRNRYADALFIQAGACNPIAVARRLVTAIDEVRAESGQINMPAIEQDPAVRLICHQLAFLLGVGALFNSTEEWTKCMEICQEKADVEVQEDEGHRQGTGDPEKDS